MLPDRTPAETTRPTLGYAGRLRPARPRSWAWIVWLAWVCVIAGMMVAGGSGMFEERFP